MVMNDTLSNALALINNYELIKKADILIKPTSKLIKNALEIMKEKGYIGDFEEIIDGRGNHLNVKLLGKINKCGAIKPKYSVKKENYEKYERRYLPAKDFGILIVSTQQGLMTHLSAKEKSLGGRLLAYVY
jgi:small subunit ribosomal protein S8